MLVPHPRYLIDYAPLPPSFAGALMCSGLTAYSALKRLRAHAARGPRAAGRPRRRRHDGAAPSRARCSRSAPIVADIDAGKREAALKAGAAAAFDPADREARRALFKATGGGVFAACDFVGSEKSLAFATGALAKGGKIVVTGLLGGSFPLPATMFVLKAMTVEGTLTGTLAEARRGDGAGARRQDRAAADRGAAAFGGAGRARRSARRPGGRPVSLGGVKT